jgi:hypothetical protein
MWIRRASALVALVGSLSAACAQGFRIEDVGAAGNLDLAQLKPGTIAFSDDESGGAAAGATNLIGFADWARTHPAQKKFLSLFPDYSEPTVTKAASADAAPAPVTEKLIMYVAQARFVLDRAPGSLDLSRYVTLAFLQKIDPAIKHKVIAAADVNALKDVQ